jgi:hypothetical protein
MSMRRPHQMQGLKKPFSGERFRAPKPAKSLMERLGITVDPSIIEGRSHPFEHLFRFERIFRTVRDPGDSEAGNPQSSRSMREIAEGMPSPTSAAAALAIFTRLELARVEEGGQTLEQAQATLDEVVQRASLPTPPHNPTR